MSVPADQMPPFPQIDTSQQPAWFDLQRKNSLQQSQNSPDPSTGNTNNPYYVTPRRSIMQNVAPLVDALMAGRANQSAMQAQQDYSKPKPQLDGTPQGPPAPDSPSDTSDSGQTFNGPFGGINVPGQTPPASGLVRQPAAAPAPAAAPPRNPMIPPGMTPSSAQQMLNLMGPQRYAEQFLVGTPEWQNALRANNGDPNAAMAQMHATAVKQGAIDMRAGGSVAIPDPTAPGGYRMVRSPNLGAGQEAIYDDSGNVVGVRNIPGAVSAGAATKGGRDRGRGREYAAHGSHGRRL